MGIFSKMFGDDDKQGGKFAQLIDAWKTDLNLSHDQVHQIREVAKGFREERKELKADGSDRSKIMEARNEAFSKIVTFLDAKQQEIFKANAAKYDAIMHQGKKD